MNTYENTAGQIAHMMEQICNEQLTTLTTLCFGKNKIKVKIMQILSPKSCRTTGCQQPRNLRNLQICQKTLMAVPESKVKWAFHITSHLLLKLNNKKVHMKYKTHYHWIRVWNHSTSTVHSIRPTVHGKVQGRPPAGPSSPPLPSPPSAALTHPGVHGAHGGAGWRALGRGRRGNPALKAAARGRP